LTTAGLAEQQRLRHPVIAAMLVIQAVISPAGTGLIYVARPRVYVARPRD
jgi:hypothetical protein